MRIELDHVFICTAPGAPEAEEFIRFGLREGSPNRHPGQGTANRRFAFANAMIELLWVDDGEEAQSDCSRRTQLWERWSSREGNASPFGICVRPVFSEYRSPFPAWKYRPSYLPDRSLCISAKLGLRSRCGFTLASCNGLIVNSGLQNILLAFVRSLPRTLTTPAPLRSVASQSMVEIGILSSQDGPESLLEIEFDGSGRKEIADFRPHLPIVFQF